MGLFYRPTELIGRSEVVPEIVSHGTPSIIPRLKIDTEIWNHWNTKKQIILFTSKIRRKGHILVTTLMAWGNENGDLGTQNNRQISRLGIVVVINVYDCRREKSRKIARVEKTLREVASFDMIRVAERLAGNGPPQ